LNLLFLIIVSGNEKLAGFVYKYLIMVKTNTDKLLESFGENTVLNKDLMAEYTAFHGIDKAYSKRWLANIIPVDLLKRSVKAAIETIMTLSESGTFFDRVPENIVTPNYGDKWGRLANYIEINNRAIAEMHGDCCCNGILSVIKMLPAIPPSAYSWANCVILSQIFPVIYGDGYAQGTSEENSIYGIRLNAGYSNNIIDFSIYEKIKPEEQLRAFNDLAHFRGIKTGFRMIISSDQIKIAHNNRSDENFSWCNSEHVELYINECAKLMNLGFEAMIIDSAKHIGGYDCEDYTGVGDLPEYNQMQYILYEIRSRSGINSISFVGEKSSDDFSRYENMGLTAGTDYIKGDNFEDVRELSEKLKYNRNYAPGIEISNDNYFGGESYEQRLDRINSALFGFYRASDKLPSFMQMSDLFPLRYDTNVHQLMMHNPSYSTDGSPESHWGNLFTKDDGKEYNKKVGELFAYALNL